VNSYVKKVQREREREREKERLSLKEISNGRNGFLSILDKTVGNLLFLNRSISWLQISQTLISAYQIARCHILEYNSRLMTSLENLQVSRNEHSSVVFATSRSIEEIPLC